MAQLRSGEPPNKQGLLYIVLYPMLFSLHQANCLGREGPHYSHRAAGMQSRAIKNQTICSRLTCIAISSPRKLIRSTQLISLTK